MKQITPEEMHDLVMKTFRKRRDTGLRNAVANAFMEPANPFQPARSDACPVTPVCSCCWPGS